MHLDGRSRLGHDDDVSGKIVFGVILSTRISTAEQWAQSCHLEYSIHMDPPWKSIHNKYTKKYASTDQHQKD